MLAFDGPERAEAARLAQRLGLDGLDEVDQAMLVCVLTAPSIGNRELGKLVGLARHAVGHRRRRPRFMEAIREATLNEIEILARARPNAARRVVLALESADERVALDASRLILRELGPAASASSGLAEFAALVIEAATGADTPGPLNAEPARTVSPSNGHTVPKGGG